MPFDPKSFADDLATSLVAQLEARKEGIIAGAGGWPRRAAVRLAWPTLVGEVPPMAEILIALVADRFGQLTVDDLLEALQRIKEQARPGVTGGDHVPQSRA